MTRSASTLPVSAVACYHVGTGAFLGVLRLRLIEALPRGVGRHGLGEQGVPGGAARTVSPEIAWHPAPDAPSGLSRALEIAWGSLRAEDLHTGLLDTLVQGNGHASSAVAEALGTSDGDASDGGVAFIECYPWERPRASLADALRVQAFHGKAIRSDLRARFAAEINPVEDADAAVVPRRGLPLAG